MQLIGMKKKLLIIFLISCSLTRTHEEVFTALANMEVLVSVERELLSMLRVYVNFVETRTSKMLQFLHKLDVGHNRNNGHCLECQVSSTNPVSALEMLHRFLYEWTAITRKVREIASISKEFKSFFSKKSKSSEAPGIKDLYGAAAAIFRLQTLYQLEAKSILTGKVSLTSKDSLKLEDTLELGKAAYYQNNMIRAKEWLDLSLEILRNTGDEDKVEKQKINVEIRDFLAVAEFELGHNMAAWNHTVEILRVEPKHERARTNLDVIVTEMNKGEVKEPKENSEQDSSEPQAGYDFDVYHELCRGNYNQYNLRSNNMHKKYLTCGYKTEKPYLVIKPVPYEVLSLDPEIVVFHNVITEGDIDLIKKLAYPKLVRATVNNYHTGVSETVEYRISKSGWLSDSDHDVIRKVSQRLEVVTGLASQTAEELQVANYGIGGHYDPHFDWARNFPISDLKAYGQGNRIATALLYMTDVEAGGGTAFLSPKVTVWPKKGSVAFWYNLFKNGTGKITTQHAACPVLLGTKWVANKWFHEYGQEFRRPCSLNRWE